MQQACEAFQLLKSSRYSLCWKLAKKYSHQEVGSVQKQNDRAYCVADDAQRGKVVFGYHL